MNGNGNINLFCLDTSLFIYFLEENPQFHQSSKAYFQKLENNSIKAVTTILTLIEILSYKNLTIPVDRLITEFSSTPNLTVIDVNQSIAIKAAKIRREYNFKLADSIQLATALFTKAKTFITNDERLKKFKELKVVILSGLK